MYVKEVMEIKGWNLYGHPGFDSLTTAQQTLIMWGDVVGQVSNGGFVQFVCNYSKSLTLAHSLLPNLDWQELTERFNRALIEQVKDPMNPVVWEPEYDVTWHKVGESELGLRGDLLNGDDEPPTDEADAFDQWFNQDSTKEESAKVIGAFIEKNRANLALLTN